MVEVIVFVLLIFRRNMKLVEAKLINNRLVYIISIIISFIFFFYFFTQFRIEIQYLSQNGIAEMVERYNSTNINTVVLYFINILYLLVCIFLSAMFLGTGQIKEKSRYLLLKSLIPVWIILTAHAYMYGLNNEKYASGMTIFSSAFIVAIPIIILLVFFKIERVRNLYVGAKIK